MNKQPLNPSGVPPIVPQNAVQKRSVQAPGGAVPNPFQQFSKQRGPFARMLTPNSYDRQYDVGHQNFLAEQSNRLTAQQAQQAATQAREAANSQFTQNAQAGGFDPAEIARMSIARNANPEEFGKSFAGNFGFNSASEGSVYSQFGRDPTKVEKTPMPLSPEEQALRQQTADAATMTAEARMLDARTPDSPLVQIGADGQGYRSINDVPEGQVVPADLLGGYKPDTGFMAVRNSEAPGGFELKPFEGGKVDRADGNRATRQERAGGTVVQDLGRALNLVGQEGAAGEIAAGPLFGLTKWVPGMPAWEVNQHLQSALSNIGIDQLQAMRDASPTGGALGQIPVQQQKRLEQMLGSLDPQAPDHVLENNIKRAMNIYMDIIHGEAQGPNRFDLNFDNLGRPLGPRPDGLTQDEWIYMDPEERALFQ
jgi:hypothetical protein